MGISHPSKQSAALSDLIQLSESSLQARIVEPLLRAMGFSNVRDNSGPHEKGKDLIAIKKSDFGRTLLYGIQLKKLNLNARVASKRSFGALLVQLKQAKEEKIVDPETNERRAPDVCVFMTPYPILPNVWERFHQAAIDAIRTSIELVDGPTLLDLIDRFAPTLMKEFSMEAQYRSRLAHELNRVPEAPIALGLVDDLELDNIYVDTSIRSSDDLLTEVSKYPLLKEGRKLFLADRHFLQELTGETRRWNVEARIYDPVVVESDHEKEELELLMDAAQIEVRKKIFQIDLDPVFVTMQAQVRDVLTGIVGLSSAPSPDVLTESLRRVVTIKGQLADLRDLVGEYWPVMVDRHAKPEWEYKLAGLDTRSVLSAGINLHVVGEAGCGKTTLLRRFTQLVAREESGLIPVYLPLVRVTNPTPAGLLKACVQQLSSYGYLSTTENVNEQQIQELRDGLASGRFRLFLDGLDETGSNALRLLTAIGSIAEEFPKCRVVLSSRYDFAGNRLKGAAELRLAPFTDAQLNLFLSRWFRSEPSSLSAISSWLKKNSRMRNAARNPLVAALMCSLFEMGAAMPNTEIDLYRQRFDLLLGRWERAKGIIPIRPDVQKRYWRFITDLAFRTHTREERFIPLGDAVHFAKDYYGSKYHREPEALVMDCVHRGIFELDPKGHIWFGHFIYQEYLAALRLAGDQDNEFIVTKLDKDWWATALQFWATIKEDITKLIWYSLEKHDMTSRGYQRLLTLAGKATWTDPDAVEELSAIVRDI
jgi:hypothetical protein